MVLSGAQLFVFLKFSPPIYWGVTFVIPAQAGIQFLIKSEIRNWNWPYLGLKLALPGLILPASASGLVFYQTKLASQGKSNNFGKIFSFCHKCLYFIELPRRKEGAQSYFTLICTVCGAGFTPPNYVCSQ